MIMSDKKKPAALIVARMSEGKKDEESEAPTNEMGDQVDDSVAKESAAEELLSALESKSPKAVAEAFDAMMELCGKYSEEED
jgi:hypothetical protein